jgi:mono/diheme cytochrome c family protein
MPSGVTPQMIAMGDSIFNSIGCRNCHGVGGVGATNGPSLKEGPWLQVRGAYPELVQLITTGVPREAIKDPARTRAMNPRGGPANLTDAQVAAVAAYVWQISRPKG